jgi:hypothetical protein
MNITAITAIKASIDLLPGWMQWVMFFFGGAGFIWAFLEKFGTQIRSFFAIKNEIKSGDLQNETDEIEVFKLWKKTLSVEMSDLMTKYNNLREKVEVDHKTISAQMKKDRLIIGTQSKYIMYTVKLLTTNNIPHRQYEHQGNKNLSA